MLSSNEKMSFINEYMNAYKDLKCIVELLESDK